jgi:dipeptidyl aminopeptidase/acylaminoacyl peptidase
VDAADVMAIATAARANHTDPDAPIHLTGGSYGGFMTNWLIGQTDMFRSAVTQRSICNWLSFYGSSDIGYVFADREVMGNPWDDTDKLWQQSPLRYVNNIKTPLLIIHAEEDHRCPIEQAEQMFIALKTRGVVTELIRYPDESHELSRSGRPDRRIHRLEAILDWFGKHA